MDEAEAKHQALSNATLEELDEAEVGNLRSSWRLISSEGEIMLLVLQQLAERLLLLFWPG